MKFIDLPVYLVIVFSILIAIFPTNYIYLGALGVSSLLMIFLNIYKYEEARAIELKAVKRIEEIEKRLESRMVKNEDDIGRKLIEINDKFGALNLSRSINRRD